LSYNLPHPKLFSLKVFFVTFVWHCPDRKNLSRKVFILLGSDCTFVPGVLTLNEKYPWFTRDSNPDPLAQQSGALTTVLSRHQNIIIILIEEKPHLKTYFTSFTCKCSKIETGCRFTTNFTLLIHFSASAFLQRY
jgi:hypothetical protein